MTNNIYNLGCGTLESFIYRNSESNGIYTSELVAPFEKRQFIPGRSSEQYQSSALFPDCSRNKNHLNIFTMSSRAQLFVISLHAAQVDDLQASSNQNKEGRFTPSSTTYYTMSSMH